MWTEMWTRFCGRRAAAVATNKLTTLAMRKMTAPGRYGDGGNLYLLVKPSGARVWTFRFTLPGQKPREMSLGNEADVPLS